MVNMVETLIVVLLVCASVFWIVRQVRRSLKGGGCAGCPGGGCQALDKDAKATRTCPHTFPDLPGK